MMKNIYSLFTIALLSTFATNAQTISTLVGTGTAGFSGDTAAAVLAKINTPYGVAADAAGNLFIADCANNRIRRVDASTGIITTYAGTGSTYFSGDGGQATNANIQAPRGICVDGAGNVIFSDYGNNRIRKITASTGIITTLCGSSSPGYGGDGGQSTLASVNYPWGVAVDEAGNIYIADQLNNRVRKINTSGIISTIGGNGIASYGGDGGQATAARIQYPTGVAIDPVGNIYVADQGNCLIRKIDPSGVITRFAGATPATHSCGYTGDGGAATDAKLNLPMGVSVDMYRNVYIADMDNNCIRKVDTFGIIRTIAGNGTAGFSGDGGMATAAELNAPTGVATNTTLGKVYISDNSNNRVRVIDYIHKPLFLGGHRQYLTACYDGGAIDLNSLLTVTDLTNGQTETWSLISGAYHGVAAPAYSTTSTGGTLSTTGTSYTPDTGYAGTDSFMVRVSNGTYSDTTTIYVNIFAGTLFAGVITGPDSLCPGHTDTLSDTVTGGVWSSMYPGVATISASGVVYGITPGMDTIIYTVQNPCDTVTAKFAVAVRTYAACRTGVSFFAAAQQEDGIHVSENPNNGIYSVTVFSASASEVHLTITNVLGQKVKEYTLKANQPFELPGRQPAGTYLLYATDGRSAYTSRVVVID